LLEFAQKVTYVNDIEMEKLPPGSAPTNLTLKLKNGQVYAKRIDYARGMPRNPLTPPGIEAKFPDLATTVIPKSKHVKLSRQLSTWRYGQHSKPY
jgi:2-methylcitrate dehydratase